MAQSGTFHCSVVTPERVVLEADARFVAFPAHDGEIGVLQNRAPLLCKVGIGPLRVEGADSRHLMYVDGGFAQVVDNRLTILTERAKKIEEIEVKSAEKAMVEARSMEITDDASFEERQKAIKRAQVQLKLKRA